jgi:molybdenum cofactor biosynthesis enzyme MoaA
MFSEKGGKFRVAIINRCNLDCFFCHNEAMANPRRGEVPKRQPDALNEDEIVRLINTYIALGGRQVNITGGEPLAHPHLIQMLESIDKRATRIVLNTNALLAHRLTSIPKIANLDSIFASLHTVDDEVFERDLGHKNGVQKVKRGIIDLKRTGYDVQINYSLGRYNVAGFGDVLDFAIGNGIDLKAIALVRSSDGEGFYGGDWIDPQWLADIIEKRGGVFVSESEGLGGRTTTYRLGSSSTMKVKNVARGRLETDLCRGCLKRSQCGEGIYGLRVGVDGLMKPCLLRRDKDRRFDNTSSYEDQILEMIGAMIGDWERARFVSGAPT